jgi:hypothetical protein
MRLSLKLNFFEIFGYARACVGKDEFIRPRWTISKYVTDQGGNNLRFRILSISHSHFRRIEHINIILFVAQWRL